MVLDSFSVQDILIWFGLTFLAFLVSILLGRAIGKLLMRRRHV